MLRTAHLLCPASTPASRPTSGASLPRTLASPRTGLAPAGCRELVARLRHEVVSFLTAPELLDAHRWNSPSMPNAGGAVDHFDGRGLLLSRCRPLIGDRRSATLLPPYLELTGTRSSRSPWYEAAGAAAAVAADASTVG